MSAFRCERDCHPERSNVILSEAVIRHPQRGCHSPPSARLSFATLSEAVILSETKNLTLYNPGDPSLPLWTIDLPINYMLHKLEVVECTTNN